MHFFDIKESQCALNYQVVDLEVAWEESVAACPTGPQHGHWQRFSDKARHLLALHSD